MEDYRPSEFEKKKAVLDVLSLYDQPLIKKIQTGVAKVNPRGYVGRNVVEKMYDQMDQIIALATSIHDPHVIHEAAARHAPHRLLDAHTLVIALGEKPLSKYRKEIEEIFSRLNSREMFRRNSHGGYPVEISRLTELLIDYNLRARSDPLFAERIPKIKEFVEKIPAKYLAPLLEQVMWGSLAPLGPHTVIDALADEKRDDRLLGKAKYLLKVAKELEKHKDRKRALERSIVHKVEGTMLKDLIIYGLDSAAARTAVFRALRRGHRR